MIVLSYRNHYNHFKLAPKSPEPDTTIAELPKIPTKILPVREIHQRLEKTQDIQKQLLLRASKHVSKVFAVGGDTAKSLKYIQQAHYTKTMRYFEFDPYLCDKSCLPELRWTYHRLKKVNRMNFVSRRMDIEDVNSKKRLAFHKFRRLTKFRLESIYNGEEIKTSPIFFVQDVARLYSIKTFHGHFVNMPYGPDKAYLPFVHYRTYMRKLEELIITKYKNPLTLNKEDGGDKLCHITRNNLHKLKKLEVSLGNYSKWIQFDDRDMNWFFFYLDYIKGAPQIEEIKFKFLKYPPIMEMVAAFADVLPSLTHIKKIELEFINSQLKDLEIVELIGHILKLNGLKQFTLKIFQCLNVDEDVIKYLVDGLVAHKTIEVFEFYTRRLEISNFAMKNLVQDMNNIEGVKCSNFKQSLHVVKGKDLK